MTDTADLISSLETLASQLRGGAVIPGTAARKITSALYDTLTGFDDLAQHCRKTAGDTTAPTGAAISAAAAAMAYDDAATTLRATLGALIDCGALPMPTGSAA